jgi:hypothetical protein
VTAIVIAAQHALVRAEVADVVAGPEPHAELVAALLQVGEERKELEQLVGLQEDVGLVGRAPHRHGELDLPAVDAERADHLEDGGQVRHGEPIDLRVARDAHAGVAQEAHGIDRRSIRPLHAAQTIVDDLVAVDRDARAVEPGLLRRRDALAREPAAARGGRHDHPAATDGADDVEPIVAEIGLAADERDLLDAEVRHLVDEVETLGGGELLGALVAGARAAVPAGEIALQRDLPHGVDGTRALIDRPRLRREGQPSQRRLRVRRDRQGARTGARDLLAALFRRERIVGRTHPLEPMRPPDQVAMPRSSQ